MAHTCEEASASLRRLTAVLGGIGDALAAPHLDALVAAEPLIEELGRALRAASATPADREALLPLLTEARLALRRCEQLGESLTAVTAITLAARAQGRAYHRDGRAPLPSGAATLEARG